MEVRARTLIPHQTGCAFTVPQTPVATILPTCYTGKTVQDVYEDDFECTAEHDMELEEVDLYQAKCHAEEFQRRVDAGTLPLSWRFANRN